MITQNDIDAFGFTPSQADWANYSDLHKDALGFRPRGGLFASQELFDKEFSYLMDTLAANEKRRAESESTSYAEWIKGVHKLAMNTRNTLGDIVRWQFDAMGLKVNSDFDREHFCYQMGFNFQDRHLIAKIK